MTAYLSGSNVQGGGDTMQTLYLMNPGYSNNPGNMSALVSSSGGVLGQNNPTFPNNGRQQQQQHFNGFVQHSGLTEASLSQQPPLASISNGNQSPPTALYTVGVNSQAYSNSWTETRNELSFLPLSDISQATQSLVARLSSVNGGQQSTSMDLSEYSLRQKSLSGIQEHQSLFSNGMALGLNSQGSTGAGEGLSLSLSPQRNSFAQLQPFQMQSSESGMSNCIGISQLTAEDDSSRDGRFLNRCTGTLSSFRASSRSGTIGNGMQNSFNGLGIGRQVHVERDPSSSLVALSGSVLACSKYLKPVQQLLHEVVNVEECIKSSKHVKVQSWMAAGSDAEISFSKSKSLSEIASKDDVGSPTGMPVSNATIIHNTLPSEPNIQNVQELTVPERQDLQAKKTKLMAMLDEVDWRYRQYCNQMQIVVTSFESAAGPGAAKTYTALALQTISRHFRCLKGSIRSQIKATSKALGEDISVQVMGGGGLSKLRFVDQQLCEQRALQQLGMMQHNAWRPQRGLPERAVSVLRAWLFEHFLHPYPKDADKSMLARQTGLSRNQVSNWFINARVRLWKPMVEEMYLEETREAEAEAEAEMETTSNSQVDNSTSKRRKEEEESTSKSAAASDATEDHHHHHQQQQQQQGLLNRSESHAHAVPHVHHSQDEVSEEMGNTATTTMLNNASDMMMMMMTRNQSMSSTPESISVMRHHPGMLKQQTMMYHDHNSSSSSSFSDPNMGMDVPLPLKSLERCGDQIQHKQLKDPGNRHNFSIPSYEAQQALGGEGFGLPYIHLGNLDSYPQEGFRYVPNGGVSLTLGLQHVDSLTSLPGAQNEHYMSNGQVYQ